MKKKKQISKKIMYFEIYTYIDYVIYQYIICYYEKSVKILNLCEF